MSSKPESLGLLLADSFRLLRRTFQQRLEGSELTYAQARALIYVSRHEGVRQVDLAELLEVQPITLARLIDHLAEAGLLERRPSPDDRRAYQIYLKPAATAHLKHIRKVSESIQAEALRGLSAQEVDMVLGALRKLRSNLVQS